MKNTKAIIIAVALIFVTISGFCAGGGEDKAYPTPENPLSFTGGHVLAPDTTQDRLCNAWADLVRERTNGAMNIEVFPAEQLGNEKALTENVNLGTIDWAFIGPGSLSRFTTEFGMFENAYTFRGLNHLENAAFNVEFIEYLSEILEAKSNLKFLGFQWIGHRHALADKPILTPEDGAGLRMRTPDVPTYMLAAYAMGATFTPLPFGEVYMALKQGVIDAAEGGVENIYRMKWHEVKKVLSLTKHVENITCIVMNRKSLEKLSPEQQKIVLEAGYETWITYFKGYVDIEKEYLEKLKAEGVTVVELTDDQLNVFIKRATDKLKEDYIPKWGKTWDKFIAFAK